MKKFFISILFILGFGGYAVYNNSVANSQTVAVSDTGSAPLPATPTSVQSAPTSSASAPPTDSATVAKTPSTPVAKPVTKKASSGQYADGTYTGTAADAYYGYIQVKAVISGGKLTDVVFLQSPSDRSTSRYINQQAMPELKAEAIRAQSANVSGVSGASDSSAAFKESLASALSKATA